MKRLLAAWFLTAAVLAAQTVEGRVVNSETGKGIGEVAVGLLGSGQVDYRATTDASGHFRMDAVKDGSYRPFYTSPDFMPVNLDAAPAFQVKAGAGPVELEIKMAPKIEISGRVLDGAGKPVANATLSLTQVSPAGMIYMFDGDANGNYHGPSGLQPGTWLLSAAAPSSWPLPEPRDGERLGWARTYYPGVTDPALAVPVAVSSDLKLQVTAPFSVACKVVMEVPEGQPAPKFPRIALEYADLAEGFMGGPDGPIPAGTPNEKGDITFSNVYPGPYLIDAPAPSPYYLDSIRMGAVDAIGPDVPISLGSGLITVTYKLNGGTVRGTVEGCGSGAVLLVPQNPLYRRDGFTYRTQCGEGGRFEITAVRPGEYYGAAFAKGGRFDENITNQSVRVSVRANEATMADLHLLAR